MARTESERLAALEATQALQHEAIMSALGEIKDDIKQIKADVQADKADLAALKNKGVGLIVGAGLAGGAAWEAIRALIGSVMK